MNWLKVNLLTIILAVALVFAVIVGWNMRSKYKIEQTAYQQNVAALNDSLTKVADENGTLYSKYSFLDNLNARLNDELTARNEKIYSQSQQIIQLKEIISEGAGVVVPPADSSAPKKLNFREVNNPFYTYDLTVTVDPPYHWLKQTFKPFSLVNFITRNKEGLWSSHVQIDSPFDQYISISDIKTVMEKDEYAGRTEDKFSLGIAPLLSSAIEDGDAHLTLGALATINKWVVGYSRGLGLNLHLIQLGYRFSIIN